MMRKYDAKSLNLDQFVQLWIRREPFVLVGVTEPQSPGQLFNLDQNKKKECSIMFYDGEAWRPQDSTLGSYFKTWSKKQSPNRSLQIRVCALTLYLMSIFKHSCHRITLQRETLKPSTQSSTITFLSVSETCLRCIWDLVDHLIFFPTFPEEAIGLT